MTAEEIKQALSKINYHYGNIFIPEFTWGKLRIDSLIIDTGHRWLRGFEIKINRSDFLRDDKYLLYTEFCSSLSLVCPEDLIQPEEVKKPIGLIWVGEKKGWKGLWPRYLKKPKNFQIRNSLSWFWTYTRVLELEMRRISFELERSK